MIVSSRLFEDYIECATKCWLRSRGEPAAGGVYAEWARTQNEAYRQDALKKLLAVFSEGDRVIEPRISKSSKDATWRIAIDVGLRTNELESRLHAVEKIASEGRGSTTQFIPYRFEFANKLTRQHKLLVAFDGLVLSEAVGRAVTLGKIMHGDGRATLKVKISAFAGEVRKRIKEITALLAGSPPGLVLNRHCGQCEFKARCSMQARENDELSLLTGISEKDRERLRNKGIFTVTQLSYTFRPRRRRREPRGKQEKYHPSLRALAIRENKIHAVGVPDLTLNGTPVFLDVEGLPDRNFYYLIGIRIQTAEGIVQRSFWADNAKEEMLIWNDFLGVISEITNPHLIHYGTYETTLELPRGMLK
jgi:predicted RecB family nuclease